MFVTDPFLIWLQKTALLWLIWCWLYSNLAFKCHFFIRHFSPPDIMCLIKGSYTRFFNLKNQHQKIIQLLKARNVLAGPGSYYLQLFCPKANTPFLFHFVCVSVKAWNSLLYIWSSICFICSDFWLYPKQLYVTSGVFLFVPFCCCCCYYHLCCWLVFDSAMASY